MPLTEQSASDICLAIPDRLSIMLISVNDLARPQEWLLAVDCICQLPKRITSGNDFDNFVQTVELALIHIRVSQLSFPILVVSKTIQNILERITFRNFVRDGA